MIIAAIKSYFKNSKYIFVAMGLIYLVILFMLYILLRGFVSVIGSVSAETYQKLAEFAVNSFQDITIEQLASIEFYKTFLGGAAEILKADIENAVRMLTTVVAITVACVLAAIMGSQVLCRTLMRKSTADDKSIRGVAAIIMRYVVSLAFGYLLVYLNTLWSYSFIFVLLLYFVHNALENLFTTWLIYFRQYKITDIFNLRNSIRLVGAGFAMIAVSAVIVLLFYLIMGAVFAILIALPLFAYTFAMLDIIAASHFRKLQEQGKLGIRVNKDKKKGEKSTKKRSC